MSEKHGGHWLEREDQGDVTIVRLKLPHLRDDEATHDLFQQIYLLVDGMHRHNIVLNLAPIDYMGSMAQGKLVLLNRKTQGAGGSLVLCQVTPALQKIFATTHLTDLLTLCPSEEEAIASFV